MSGRKAVEIKRFGPTQVYAPEDESKSVAIIVFVHGLFGHPQRTWTGRKERERRNPSREHRPSSSSRRLGPSTENERLSEAADSGTEPEVSNDASSGGISPRGSETHRSSMVVSSQIVGIQAGEVFWPEAILPSVLPEARIYTWGYDADVDAFNTSVGHNTVEQHATDFLTDIANLSERLGELARPVVFVVHSLGGIVVKEALNIASQSEIERLKNVASATYGISFLGTPHRGSGSATIGKHAYRIARLATKRPNIKLLRSLEKNSDNLKGISNRFRSTQQKWNIKISSFYEDREVRKFAIFHSLIVDNESAQIGHPGEEVSSIPKNHREMTKFTSSEEVGFERVSAQLRRWVNDIRVNSQAKHKSAELEDCLSSLENMQTRARYINVASSYDGTLRWLFDRDIVPFASWLEDDQNVLGPCRPVFWINGKPGSGKSTLMKFAMRDERTREFLRKSLNATENPSETRSEWIILGFFFHDRGSHIQKSTEGMLQGVLHQLLSQVPDLLPFIYTIYDDLVKVQRTSKPAWTFDSLCAAWQAVTQQRKFHRYACIFLDALDEQEGDNSQLSKFIYTLISSADGIMVKIKICVASRTWNVFKEHFGTSPQLAIHEHTTGDIQTYTSQRLSASLESLGEATRLALQPKIERLSSQVTNKAHGVFIWVRIVLDELIKGIRDGSPISLLEEALSNMPEELEDLYRHTLERIERDYAEEAYIMLQIALCTISSLPIKIFMNCISFSKRKKVYEATEDEIIRQLTSRSGGLLEMVVISSRQGGQTTHVPTAIQFIHQTVKDFVAENRNNLGLHLDPTFNAESGYLYCLQSATTFGGTWADSLSRDIFEYAFLAEMEGSTNVYRLQEAFLPMLVTSSVHPTTAGTALEWFSQKFPEYGLQFRELSNYMMLLVLTAAAGLKNLVTYQIDLWKEHVPSVRLPDALLLTFVATGKQLSSTSDTRQSMIKLLLKLGVDPKAICGPIDLKEPIAIESGYHKTHSSHTPLAWVLRRTPRKYISEEQAHSIAQLLLESGASPDTLAVPDDCCPEGTSLMRSCIQHYDVQAVRLLLLHEVNISSIDLPLIFHMRMREGEARESGEETLMSDLLEEYGIQTRWETNTLHPGALLAMRCGLWTTIATPPVAMTVGWAYYKSITL